MALRFTQKISLSKNISIAALLIPIFLLIGCDKPDAKKLLYSKLSPNSEFIAEIIYYSHNGISSADSYSLDMVKIHSRLTPEKESIVFSMDYEGSKKYEPIVNWASNNKLCISVRNGASIEHWSTQNDKIQVRVNIR
jgi:hypothetical protein